MTPQDERVSLRNQYYAFQVPPVSNDSYIVSTPQEASVVKVWDDKWHWTRKSDPLYSSFETKFVQNHPGPAAPSLLTAFFKVVADDDPAYSDPADQGDNMLIANVTGWFFDTGVNGYGTIGPVTSRMAFGFTLDPDGMIREVANANYNPSSVDFQAPLEVARRHRQA